MTRPTDNCQTELYRQRRGRVLYYSGAIVQSVTAERRLHICKDVGEAFPKPHSDKMGPRLSPQGCYLKSYRVPVCGSASLRVFDRASGG